MRQTGVLTAMCLYALDHHVERLAEDHARAKRIETALEGCSLFARVLPVETNIVLAETSPAAELSAAEHKDFLASKNVKVMAVGSNRIRMITHLDVDDAAVSRLIKVSKPRTLHSAIGDKPTKIIDYLHSRSGWGFGNYRIFCYLGGCRRVPQAD